STLALNCSTMERRNWRSASSLTARAWIAGVGCGVSPGGASGCPGSGVSTTATGCCARLGRAGAAGFGVSRTRLSNDMDTLSHHSMGAALPLLKAHKIRVAGLVEHIFGHDRLRARVIADVQDMVEDVAWVHGLQ